VDAGQRPALPENEGHGMMSARLRRDDMESAMAWLSLLLFLPWFLLLGSLYWLFPRQPRTPRRRLFDGTTLLLAFALSIVSMLWGYRLGMAQPGAGPIWPQVLAVLYAYGAFLAVLVVALLLRPRWLGR